MSGRPWGAAHSQPCPFPVSRNGKIIVDERCTCGRLRTDHTDTLSFGHGAAPGCSRFTWAAFVEIDADRATRRAKEKA